MKRAIIVHGFKGKPDTNWKPWLKRELEGSGFQVDVPEMPNTDHPEVSAWVSKLASTIGEIGNDEVYLIGHSLGCITILKYLETVHEDHAIKASIFVAGFARKFNGYGGGHDSFFDTDLDYRTIRNHCDDFVAIHSDDDPSVGIEELAVFKDNLHAKTIAVSGMGHFGSGDSVFELPILRDVVLGI